MNLLSAPPILSRQPAVSCKHRGMGELFIVTWETSNAALGLGDVVDAVEQTGGLVRVRSVMTGELVYAFLEHLVPLPLGARRNDLRTEDLVHTVRLALRECASSREARDVALTLVGQAFPAVA